MSEAPVCPLCRSPLESRTFTIHRACYRGCAGCGSYRRETPEVSLLQMREYRERYGDRKEIREAARERQRLWPPLLARIEADLGERGGAAGRARRLLDVGCGFGDFACLARERGWEVEGIEINPTMLEVCRSRGLVVHPAPVEERASAGPLFDAITYLNVLDSLETPTEELAAVRRLLVRGGRVWIRVPNGAFHGAVLRGVCRFRALSRRWARWGVSPLNAWLFSAEGLRQALQSAGFEDVEVAAAGIPHHGWPLQVMERAFRGVSKVCGSRVWSTSLLASGRAPGDDFVCKASVSGIDS